MAQLLTGTRIYGTGTVDTQLFVNGTNSATSTTTGALQVVGGVGIGGNLHVGGIIYGAILGTATTATNADNIKTVSQTTNTNYYPTFVDANNSTAAYEALYTTSSFVINPQSGNVGIGESDPLRKFVVRSDSSGSITAIGIYNGSTATSNGSVISFRSDTTGTGAATFQEFAGFSTTYTDKNHATRSGDFNIFTANSGTVATRVIVKSTGNVGIGTSTPLSKFVVNGGTVDSTTYTSSEARIADGTLHLMKTSAGGVFEALRAINNDTTVGTTVRLLAAATSDPFNNANGGKVFIDAVRTAANMDLIFSLNDTGGAAAVERLRILGSGAIAFNGSTNYGITGQILQSNGNAAPTWISTGSLFAANATTATHLSGGVAGQIPYQTAPGVTAFLSTGTAGDVLVSNGSSAATYNNTLRLAGSTNATSTTSGALQVVGGVGVGGDLFIHGDIRTNDTLFNLINGNATTVNFAGDATTLTMGASGSGTTNVRNNLTVSGNLTVQGTTTIVDSTVTNIADPIITLGGGTGNSAPTADDNKDRGVAFKWVNNGGTTSTGFFGYDDSTGYLTYVQTATITNEVVSGTKGAMDVNLAGGTAMAIVYQSSPNNTAFLAASTSGFLLQTNGTGSAPTWVSASGVSAGSATYADSIRTIAQTASASYYPTFVDSNNASNAYESLYTTSSFVVNPATGAVSISGLLTVSASSGAGGIAVGSNADRAQYQYINFGGSVGGTDYAWQVGRSPSGGVGPADGFYIYDIKGSSTRVSIDGSGNVGIGTITPRVKLSLLGAATGVVELANLHNTGILTGDGSSLTFSGYLAPSAYPTWRYAGIKGVYDTTSSGLNSGNWGGQLRLFVNRGGAADQFEDVVTITGGGNVGIGTNAPLAKLHIEGNSLILNTEGSVQAKTLYFRYSNGATVQSDSYLVFGTGGSPQERMRITSTGGISFGASGTAYGSSGFVLKSNGDAAPTWVDPNTLASASATNADNIRTVARTTNASHFLTFVDSNNASAAYEPLYTTSSFTINPESGVLTTSIGSAISYGDGTTYLVWIDEPEVSVLHTSADSNYKNMKTFVASKSGSFKLKFSAYIQSGAKYWGWRILKNGSTVPAGPYAWTGSLDSGQTASVHGYVRFAVTISDVAPGDSFVLQMVSTAGGSTPDTGSNQLLYAKEFRVYSTTPSVDHGGATNIWGAQVGIGTTSPTTNLHVYTSNASVNSSFLIEHGNTSRYALMQFKGAGAKTFEIGTGGSGTGSYNGALYFYDVTAASERLRITTNGAVAFGGSTNYGTSGQVLQSNGDAAPTWINQSSITSGATSLTSTYVGFGSGSNLLTGSSSLTWNGATFYVNGRLLNAGGLKTYSVQTSGQGAVNAVYEIMKVSRDSVNWSTNTSYEITVYSSYYAAGGYAKYLLSYGYGDSGTLVCTYAGGGGGMLRVYIGSEVSVNANCQYKPVFVDLPPYMMCTVEVRYNTTEVASVGAINSSGQVFFSNIMTASGGTGAFYNGNTHLVPNGGNVGIGTISPTAKLEISGGWSSGAGLKINYGNSSGTIEAVNFISNGGTNGAIGMQMVSAGVGDLWLGGSGGRSLTLYRDGNVGINSTAPGSKLSVEGSGTANESVARFNNQGNYASRIWLRNSSRSAYFSVSGSTGDTLATGSLPYGLLIGLSGPPSPVQFYNGTSGAVKMTIDTDGNVGIGTTSPTNKFEVAGSAGQLFSVSDSFTGTIFSVNDVSGIPSIEVLDTGLVKMAQYNGAVAIGTGTITSSTAELSVYGMLYTLGSQGEIRASSEITAYFSSDARLKENIKLIENPITIIDQIRGVTFDWTDEHMARRGGEDGYFVRKHDIGVIAQEVQAVLPELVGTREDGYLAVKYEKMVPLLIEAIKAQQKTIDSLVKDLDNVKEFINDLKNKNGI